MSMTTELAQTKELAFLMSERFTMNPISCKHLNEAWREAFPDEVAVAKRMLALVEALEARDKQIAELRVSNRILCSDAMAKQERIAELEARTVTVKLPAEKFCPAEYAGSQLWSETEVWNKAITACADALRAAGAQVLEGEQNNG